MKAGDVNGTFTYRVVAKRKDVKADRLARFDLPKAITIATPLVPPAEPNVPRPPLPRVVEEPPRLPRPRCHLPCRYRLTRRSNNGCASSGRW